MPAASAVRDVLSTLPSNLLLFVIWVDDLEHQCRNCSPGEIGDEKDPNVQSLDSPITVIPMATAGLNAPPETPPTAKAPTSTVKPIARPK